MHPNKWIAWRDAGTETWTHFSSADGESEVKKKKRHLQQWKVFIIFSHVDTSAAVFCFFCTSSFLLFVCLFVSQGWKRNCEPNLVFLLLSVVFQKPEAFFITS